MTPRSELNQSKPELGAPTKFDPFDEDATAVHVAKPIDVLHVQVVPLFEDVQMYPLPIPATRFVPVASVAPLYQGP